MAQNLKSQSALSLTAYTRPNLAGLLPSRGPRQETQACLQRRLALPSRKTLATLPTCSAAYPDTPTPPTHLRFSPSHALCIAEPLPSLDITKTYPLTKPSHRRAKTPKTSPTLFQPLKTRLGTRWKCLQIPRGKTDTGLDSFLEDTTTNREPKSCSDLPRTGIHSLACPLSINDSQARRPTPLPKP